MKQLVIRLLSLAAVALSSTALTAHAQTCDQLFATNESTVLVVGAKNFAPHVLTLASELVAMTHVPLPKGNTSRPIAPDEVQKWLGNSGQIAARNLTDKTVLPTTLLREFERLLRTREFPSVSDRNRLEWTEIARTAEAAYNGRVQRDLITAYFRASGEELRIRALYAEWMAEFLTHAQNPTADTYIAGDGSQRFIDFHRIDAVQKIAVQRAGRPFSMRELLHFTIENANEGALANAPVYPPLFDAIREYALRVLPAGVTLREVLEYQKSGEGSRSVAMLHARFQKEMLEMGYSDVAFREAIARLR